MIRLKLTILVVIVMSLFTNSINSQNTKEIQHIKFDDLGWEQLGDKLQRKYVYGEQGMLALFKMDKGTASYFGNNNKASNNLEVVAAMDIRPGDVAVSAEGRVFATIHPLGSQKTQLVEIVNGKTVPYPSAAYQKNGKKASDATFDAMLGLIFDKNNQLWVADMGLELGKTRLWAFDINKNTVSQKIELPASVAPKGTFAQDVAIDEKNNFAYLADIANPGIIVLNLKTKKVRRFSGHASLQAEDKDMIIKGKVIHFGGKPARVAIDPITLSSDRETIFFGAMNGSSWYSLPAKLLREGKNDSVIGGSIRKIGNKPFSDGAITDSKGNHYFTNLQEHAITKLDATGKLTNIIQDNEKIVWPDNVYQGPNDWMYISVNQLDSSPAFTGATDEGKPPYYIYRFKQ
ncbi:cupin [Flavobacterium sp. F-65]|uniref:Cupin n=1 Tax=Flavobacterium pisciphilum TaxID=2893755 RepID=A0ABS8MPY4_9FLAO|nr:L-dopachrome tautomerase-related protein [Flavobacterium sp. F-65]MCC9070187.1 cupin [Flavobacterium sp. F-65]